MNDMDVVCTITWTVGDVRTMLEEQGIDPSDASVERFVDENARHLQDRSIERGWEIMETLIQTTDFEEE